MRTLLLVTVFGVAALAGCAPSPGPMGGQGTGRAYREDRVEAKAANEAALRGASVKAGPPGGRAQAEGDKRPAELPRKVIYNADVSLIVGDLSAAEEQLKGLIKDHKGYVAQSDSTGKTGAQRTATWKVRIPVEGFDDFLAAVLKLGVPDRTSTDSKDVSEEFYDVQARVKAKKVEEDRLLKHLDKSTGKLDEILAVERELSRVRGEIEQLEGRLQVLSNLTELTTITVNLREDRDYVPPQAPTFGQNVSDTFWGSLHALEAFGKALVLFAVAVGPWLPIPAILGVLIWVYVRRKRSAAAS